MTAPLKFLDPMKSRYKCLPMFHALNFCGIATCQMWVRSRHPVSSSVISIYVASWILIHMLGWAPVSYDIAGACPAEVYECTSVRACATAPLQSMIYPCPTATKSSTSWLGFNESAVGYITPSQNGGEVQRAANWRVVRHEAKVAGGHATTCSAPGTHDQ
jgi:hypothetical protein